MGNLLIENYSQDFILSEEKSNDTNNKSGILGKLKGIFADIKHPTRNGRLYSEKCWRNALASEDVKEKLENHMMLMELSHPTDRLESLEERTCAYVSDLKIDEQQGVVLGEAVILDTPMGRILNTFVRSGMKVGVSSRGAGDERIMEGVNQIDPDTFILETFDIVSMPAVKQARLSLCESKQANVLTETFVREIKSAKSEKEVDSLVSLAEGMNIPNFSKIKEEAINKLGGDVTLPVVENKNDYSKEVDSLKESLSVSNTKLDKSRTLITEMSKNSQEMTKQLLEQKELNKKIMSDYQNLALENHNLISRNENLSKSLEFNKGRVSYFKEKFENSEKENELLNESIKKVKSSYNKQFQDSIKNESKEIRALRERVKVLEENNSKLSKINSQFNKKLIESEQANKKLKLELESKNSNNLNLLTESKEKESSLVRKLESVTKYASNATLEYLKVASKLNGLDPKVVREGLPKDYKITDIDKVISRLSENKAKLESLPFSLSNHKMIVESLNQNRELSEEDIQTSKVFSAFKKRNF